MEDLRARLKYDDINIRSRCLHKLLDIVKKKTKGNVINLSSVQIPELSLILESCEDDSAITSNLAVQVVTSLVLNKSMDVDYAINRLLGCMKSPSNYQSVLKGISLLLLYEIDHTSESKALKYSLCFPKHPLITALENKPDCFPFILDCLSESLKSDPKRTIQVMEPVICDLLCDPSHTQDLNVSKALLFEALSLRVTDAFNFLQLLFKYIPFMQVDTVHRVAELSYCFKKVYDVILELFDSNQNISCYVELFLLCTLSLAERAVILGHSPSQTMDYLEDLCSLLPKINKSSIPVNICLLLIAKLCKSTSGTFLDKYFKLGLKLLDISNTSPTVAAIVALSVIHLLPEQSLSLFNDSARTLLPKFLKKLQNIYLTDENGIQDSSSHIEDECSLNKPDSHEDEQSFKYVEAFTQTLQSAVCCVEFCKVLDKSDSNYKIKWLESIKLFADASQKETFDTVFSLVSALFLMSAEEKLLSSCLETLESLIVKTPHLSTRLFSLLLYKMNCVECPRSKFLIMNFLPKSAVHKYSIPPVLSVLKMMTNESELKAYAIYLMLQLWKRQGRCFPHLQTLLTEPTKFVVFDSGVNETLVAQAAAILEICSSEPEKHGHEFLNTLSSIFNKCNDESSTAVACLAVDGIITLCKAEIIDIHSTWKALSARLNKDKRILVSCRMYQLLSLIPDLRVKSFDYDKFMNETVIHIWKQISSGTYSSKVLAEAYKTISKFPMDCHVLKHLPAAAKTNLKLPASMKATPFEMSKLPEDVLSYIPGYCFVDLMRNYEDEIILEGYISFLHSLLQMEVEELPRSAYSQTRHVAKQKKVSEALSKVPEFLCTLFHSRKSPALQKNLAVGVLFCYEPPIEMGKDGLPLKRSIATQSRSYEQVLTVLLNEVNIDATEWHRCILISSAWGSFMERAIFACEEARRAELELQRAHGQLNLTPEELNEQCKSAWLWVRERFLGIIKTNIKNTPTAHANGIFAISGLVFALDKFYSSLDETSKTLADENEKYLNHRHFVAEYVETVLCAMYPEYQPTGKVQSWLLTHLSRPNSSVSFLVMGCASSSLCHLTPILMSHYATDIPDLLKTMLQNVGHSSPVLSFYTGKGIGLFIKSLCEAGYLESEGTQVNLLLYIVKEMMKMYEDSEGSLTSCLIGVTISLISLSQMEHENVKDWVSTTCNAFYEKLMDEEKSSMQFEMLCICVTAMIISAVEGSCLPIQKLEDLSSWIDMNRLELPQCSGISISLGLLIEAFEKFGHPEGSELRQKVLKGWFNTVTSERKHTLQKIAALNGLCTLFSGGRGLIQVKSQLSPELASALNDLLPVMFQILTATRDTGLQSICSWEVGRLYAVNTNQQQVESSVPSSYSYLGEKSILKPVMNVILSCQKADETEFKYCHLMACLKSLATPFSRPLPPINWVLVLSPFLQQSEDKVAAEAALRIAIYQCNGSSYAVNLVSSYSNPPLFHTLQDSCYMVLLENIPLISLALPPAKLQVYLQTIISNTIKKDDLLKTHGNISLQGILKALKQTGYKEQSKKILHDAVISVIKFFKAKELYICHYLPWVAETLLLLPENIQNSQLQLSQNSEDISVITLIWCYLVKTGKKPLSCLRSCIEEAKCCPAQQKEKICLYIYDCFLNGSQNKGSEASQSDKCISWLLETIGWIRVLEDTKSKYQLITTAEVYEFLVDVCLATIIGCSGLESSYSLLLHQSINHQSLLQSMPQAITILFCKTEWIATTDKVIEWFLMMLKSKYIKEEEKTFVKLSLCSLRSSSQFQKKEVWTDVMCNIYITK